MKKYGKYEKRPEAAPVKQPKVKSALLQTYLTSLLCMVLCVTMFLGTSYAWFTSEVENVGNEIYVGTLKVGLYKLESGSPVSLVSSDANNEKLFDGDIRWEPGYTTLETIQVVNEGDLAFKYVLNFTDGTAKNADDSEAVFADVAKCFDVWVYDHRANEGKENVILNPDSYAALTAENSGWVPAGSLDELLAGKAVLDGNMVTVRKEGQETANINKGTTDGVATEDTYTIALHMKEDANDPTLMGKKITLNVKLVAYQKGSEKDGFGNEEYDNFTGAVNAANLKSTLANSNGDVLLATNVEIKDIADVLSMSGTVVLDGNGKTVSYSGGRNASDGSVGVLTTSGGTIKNLKIDGKANGRALYVTNLTSNLFVSDCTLSGAYAFNLNSAEDTNYTITFTNTMFKSWTSYANAVQHAYFTGCTFENNLRPYASTTLKNCRFVGENAKLDISKLEDGEVIILDGCTFEDGTAITTDNISRISSHGGRTYAATTENGQIKLTVSAGTVTEN